MDGPSDYTDEVEVLQMMFPSTEELEFKGIDPHNDNYALLVFNASSSASSLSLSESGAAADITVEIRIPVKGYPDARRPVVRVTAAPNVDYTAQLNKALQSAVSSFDLGVPMLSLLMGALQEEVAAIAQSIEAEAAQRDLKREAEDAHRRAVEEELASMELGEKKKDMYSSKFNIRIERGEIIADRKSRFLAHIAKVRSIEEVEDVVRELASNKWLAASAHPTIYAYRFVDKEGRVSQDAEDDGEDGASKKMLFLLEQCKVLGYVLVVTRWFGGILLGPDRFKRIMECSRQALQQHKVIE